MGASPGDQIGPYEVITSLRGQRTATYLARRPDRGGGREFVLFVLELSDADASILADELERCRKLQHPAVTRVEELFEHRSGYVLVLSSSPGTNLHRLMHHLHAEGERLADAAVFYIGQELLGALAEAHEATDSSGNAAAILHGDLGPHQVFLSWRGSVTLMGMGLSRVFRLAADAPPELEELAAYEAPERQAGQALTPAANVYSAAAILWSLLTGRALTRSTQSLEPLSELRPELPPELRSAIELALHPDPAKRTITSAQLAKVLDETDGKDGRHELGFNLEVYRESENIDAGFIAPESVPPRVRTSSGPRAARSQPAAAHLQVEVQAPATFKQAAIGRKPHGGGSYAIIGGRETPTVPPKGARRAKSRPPKTTEPGGVQAAPIREVTDKKAEGASPRQASKDKRGRRIAQRTLVGTGDGKQLESDPPKVRMPSTRKRVKRGPERPIGMWPGGGHEAWARHEQEQEPDLPSSPRVRPASLPRDRQETPPSPEVVRKDPAAPEAEQADEIEIESPSPEKADKPARRKAPAVPAKMTLPDTPRARAKNRRHLETMPDTPTARLAKGAPPAKAKAEDEGADRAGIDFEDGDPAGPPSEGPVVDEAALRSGSIPPPATADDLRKDGPARRASTPPPADETPAPEPKAAEPKKTDEAAAPPDSDPAPADEPSDPGRPVSPSLPPPINVDLLTTGASVPPPPLLSYPPPPPRTEGSRTKWWVIAAVVGVIAFIGGLILKLGPVSIRVGDDDTSDSTSTADTSTRPAPVAQSTSADTATPDPTSSPDEATEEIGDDDDGASLPATVGYVVVRCADKKLHVYALGKRIGLTNQKLVTRCGRTNLRLGDYPLKHWHSEGRSLEVACQALTTVTIETTEPTRRGVLTAKPSTPPGTPPRMPPTTPWDSPPSTPPSTPTAAPSTSPTFFVPGGL